MGAAALSTNTLILALNLPFPPTWQWSLRRNAVVT